MGKWIKWSFVLMIFSIFLALAAKFYSYGDPLTFSLIFVICSWLFALCAGIEVWRSPRIDESRKKLWIFGFILSGPIAGYFYVVHARKRITGAKQDMGDVL